MSPTPPTLAETFRKKTIDARVMHSKEQRELDAENLKKLEAAFEKVKKDAMSYMEHAATKKRESSAVVYIIPPSERKRDCTVGNLCEYKDLSGMALSVYNWLKSEGFRVSIGWEHSTSDDIDVVLVASW